jgi:hypothetical protein
MNDYWNSCCLLCFTGIRTGSISPLRTPEEMKQQLIEKGHPPVAEIRYYPFPDITNVDAWPKLESDQMSGEKKFIEEAFQIAFDDGYRKVVGLFCLPPAITTKQLEEAFLSIRPLDVCLGADTGGGLYLLGMNAFEPTLIQPQPFGQSTLAKSITREIGTMKKIMYKLPVLGI